MANHTWSEFLPTIFLCFKDFSGISSCEYDQNNGNYISQFHSDASFGGLIPDIIAFLYINNNIATIIVI